MKSRIYSSGYVKAASKGSLWIPVFLTIGFLMAFPVAELIKLGNWFGMEYTTEQIGLLYENLWKDGFLNTGYVIVVIAAAINGISQFWYLYSSRKVDFYHCLPVKRSTMFWHKTYVGVLYYLIPYAVIEFLTICIGAMRGFFSLNLMKLALIMLLIHLLLYLLLYFGVVLVISITGNLLMGGLCLGGMFIYGPMLSSLITSYQDVFFDTYAGIPYGITKFLYNYTSPLQLGIVSRDWYNRGKCGAMVLILLTVVIVMGTASYFAYIKRAFEKTGKPLVYPWTAVVLRFLVTIPAGLGVGILFYVTPTNISSRRPWWIFGMIVGTVFAHGILETIIQMDFRRFFGHKLQLALSGAVVAVCALNFQFDLQGYDTYVPEYDSIAGMSTITGMLGEYFDDITEENGYYVVGRNTNQIDNGIDIGISQDIYKIIKDAAASAKQRDYEMSEDRSTDTYCSFRYLLKSGKSVYRNYRISAGQIEKLLLACYEEGTFKSVKYSSLGINVKYLKRVSGCFANGKEYVLLQNDSNKRNELINALKEDIKEASPETLTGMPCAMLALSYEGIPRAAEVTSMVPGHISTAYVSSNYYIYPEFKRTIAILRETGYPLSLEEVSLDKVEVRYWIGDSDEETETITYTDNRQLQEIKKALVSTALCPTWKDSVHDFSEINVVIDGEEAESGWVLEKDKYPEFMKSDEKTARPDLVKYSEDAEGTAYDTEYGG